MRRFESLFDVPGNVATSHVLANVATGWAGACGARKLRFHRSNRQRRGGAMTVLVVVVLAAAMAGLTMAATSMMTSRTEQLRRGRASEIQRMLEAGRQWVQVGGLSETPDVAGEATRVQLPSFADGPEDSPGLKIEKVLEIQIEPDNQIRMTAMLQRVRGDQPTVLATRTIRFASEPRDTTSASADDSSPPDTNDSEPDGSDADEPDSNGDN